jgi:hypothetical protein
VKAEQPGRNSVPCLMECRSFVLCAKSSPPRRRTAKAEMFSHLPGKKDLRHPAQNLG